MVLVLVLLLKFTLIKALLVHEQYLGLLLALVWGRASAVLLFLTTDYVRAGGLGDALQQYLPRAKACWVLLLCVLLTLGVGWQTGFAILTLVALCFVALRHMMRQRIGGTTGDTAGALIEWVEVVVLLAVVVSV